MDPKQQQERFEAIFKSLYPKVKAFAFKLLKSESEAEDIAQDVFVKLWNSPGILEEHADCLTGYVYAMTRNHILNSIKHKSVHQNFREYISRWSEYCDPADSSHNSIHVNEILLLTMLTVKNMPEQRQKIFRMSRFEHLSHAEIAEKLGLSVRTVERHIYLALNDLKKVLLAFIILCWLQ